MEPPKYDGKESINKYMRKVEEYRLKLLEDKYSLILEFINDLMQAPEQDRLKSLSDFTNISEDIILRDLKHNRQILRKYGNLIIEKLNVKFDVDEETNSDEIEDYYIFYFLSKVLSSIDYRLVKNTFGEKISYSIRIK